MLFKIFKSNYRKSFKNTPIRMLDCWVIDGEMSGCSPKDNALISFVAIPIRKKKLILRETKAWKIKPEVLNVDPKSMTIHKLTEEDISKGMDEAKACREIANCLSGQTLIGHNIGFDLGFLKQLFQTYKIECLFNVSIDTGKLMNWYFNRINPHTKPEPKSLKLENLIHSMDLPQYPPHDAFNDTLMIGALFLRLLEIAQNEGYTNLEELTRLQSI